MKKVFISQPIENKTIEEINGAKIKAIEYLESKGYEVVNKEFMNELDIKNPSNKNYLINIGKNIYKMSECDAIYFTEGWSTAKNCRIERLASLFYNIEILEN